METGVKYRETESEWDNSPNKISCPTSEAVFGRLKVHCIAGIMMRQDCTGESVNCQICPMVDSCSRNRGLVFNHMSVMRYFVFKLAYFAVLICVQEVQEPGKAALS